jgi:CDP-diglyceride synthetase
VDHGDDRRTDQGTSPGAGEHDAPTGPSGRVRIVGAERAFDATAVVPAVTRKEPLAGGEPGGPDEPDDGRPSVRLTGEPGHKGDEGTVDPVEPGGTAVPRAAEGWNGSAVLPHWTEPPTGQVPAILERDRSEGSATGPTWREEHADWDAHDESFDAALFAPDEGEEVGSLDESGGPDLERRPWEFDLPEPVARGDDDEVTQPVPSVGTAAPTSRRAEQDPDDPFLVTWGAGRSEAGEQRRDEPEDARGSRPPAGGGPDGPEGPDGQDRGSGAEGSRSGAGVPADEPGEIEEVFGTSRGQPSGTVPVGRMRRGTMRMPRVRAKRPDDADARFDEPPLAASPPGATVTAVPGAGRRRGGIADLAAADRQGTRQRADGEDDPGDADHGSGSWSATGEHEVAGGAGEEPEVRAGSGSAEAAERAGEPGDDVWEPGAAPRWDETAAPPDAPARGRARRRGRARGEVWDADEDEGAPPVRRGRAHSSPTRGAEAARARRIPPVEEPGRRPARRRGEDEERRGGRGGGAATRITTGVVAAAVALAAFAGGAVTSLVLVAVVVTFSAGEAFGALRRAGYRPATLLGLAGTVALLVGAYTKGPQAVPLVLVLLVAFSFAWYLFGIDHSPPLAGVASTLLVVGWISLMGAFAALLLAPSAFPHRHGVAFLLGAIIATVANDVGALVFGAWLGRRPLAPRVSPNKTWEGLIGGTIVSIVVSVGLVGAMHPWTASSAAILGVVVSIVAPIGDLSESLLKRDLRTKDMGRLLPGHGGVLDRVDAMLFVLPATYYLVRVLNLG